MKINKKTIRPAQSAQRPGTRHPPPRMIDYPRTTTTGGAMYYEDEDSDDRDDTLDPAPDFGEWCDERLRATPRALWPLSSIIDAYEAETGAPAPLPAEALDELSARYEIDPRGGSEPLIAAARRA